MNKKTVLCLIVLAGFVFAGAGCSHYGHRPYHRPGHPQYYKQHYPPRHDMPHYFPHYGRHPR